MRRPLLGTIVALRQPLRAIREQVTTAEALGYHSVWLPEISDRDALVLAATLGQWTDRIVLATGVVPLRSRSLPLLAMAAMASAEASGGRLWLGVGGGHSEMTGPWHDRGQPARACELRDAVNSLRVLMAGGPSGAPFRLRPFGPPPPVMIGGLSAATMRIAGECADGVLLNWATGERAGRLAAAAREAAERAGRDPGEFVVASYLPVAVTDEADDARRRFARQVGAYLRLTAYRRGLETAGFAEQARRAAAAGPEDPDGVPSELLDVLGAIGSREHVLARVAELRAAGIDLPVLAPVPSGDDPWGSMVATWTALADEP